MDVIRINKFYCQVSFLHTFLQCVSKEVMTELDKTKRKYLISLKEYFEKGE